MTRRNHASPMDLDKDLDAHIRDALEPDPASIARLEAHLETRLRRAERTSYRVGWPRAPVMVGFASALGLVLTLAVFTASPWGLTTESTPSVTSPTDSTSIAMSPNDRETPRGAAASPPIVISNTSGFVTVTSGGSQWIVLPGDRR